MLQYDRLCVILTKHLGKPLSHTYGSSKPYVSSTLDTPSLECLRDQGSKASMIDLDDNNRVVPSNPHLLAQQTKVMLETAKDSMVKTAVEALKELVKLLQVDEPLWTKSVCGRYTLNPKNYEGMFSRATHLKNPDVRIKSSKDSTDVNINAVDLVSMMLEPVSDINCFANFGNTALRVVFK